MNLSFRQLKGFLAVARLRNFTRAAEELHLSQAGLSLMVRELEAQLDCRLFDRTTRGVELTDAGQRLLPSAVQIVAHMDGIARELADSTRSAQQTLHIAATPLISATILPPIFRTFASIQPRVAMKLSDVELPRVQAMVAEQHADFGLGFMFTPVPGLDRRSLCRFRLMRVSPVGEPATSARRGVPWTSLKDMPLIGLPRSNPIQQMIEKQLRKIGRGPSESPEFNLFETLIAMVEAGMGHAVVPSFALLACERRRVRADLLLPAVSLDFYRITRRGTRLTDAASAFCDAIGAAMPALTLPGQAGTA